MVELLRHTKPHYKSELMQMHLVVLHNGRVLLRHSKPYYNSDLMQMHLMVLYNGKSPSQLAAVDKFVSSLTVSSFHLL